MSKYYRVSIIPFSVAQRYGIRTRHCEHEASALRAAESMYHELRHVSPHYSARIQYQALPDSGPSAAEWRTWKTLSYKGWQRTE